MKRILIVLLLISLLPASATVFADKPQKAYKKQNQGQHGQNRNYHAYQKPPKGWQKKLVIGQPVSHELTVYLQDLPRELAKTLPPLPSGVSYKRIEDEIIKVHNANMKVLEVIRDIGIPVPVLPKIK